MVRNLYLAHVGVVLTWLSQLYLLGSITSNYLDWLAAPAGTVDATSGGLLNVFNQRYLNPIKTLSGMYHVWYGSGIVTLSELSSTYMVISLVGLLSFVGSYYHMQGNRIN